MSYAKSFRELRVWQLGMSLVQKVDHIVKQLRPEDRFEIASQMRRAASSIPANIAEGFGKRSHRNFSSYLLIARGSANELETHLEQILQRGEIPAEQLHAAIDLCIHTRVLITRMLRSMPSQQRKQRSSPTNS
jgi:four helix bundle protein